MIDFIPGKFVHLWTDAEFIALWLPGDALTHAAVRRRAEEKLKMNPRTTSRYMKRLVEARQLVRTTAGRSAYYSLAAISSRDVAELARSTLDTGAEVEL